MPKFELVSLQEAKMTSSRPGRSEVIQEYVRQIEGLGRDEAVRLSPSDGETVATVRRRLGAAVKVSGKGIRIKRIGSDIYSGKSHPEEEEDARARIPLLEGRGNRHGSPTPYIVTF